MSHLMSSLHNKKVHSVFDEVENSSDAKSNHFSDNSLRFESSPTNSSPSSQFEQQHQQQRQHNNSNASAKANSRHPMEWSRLKSRRLAEAMAAEREERKKKQQNNNRNKRRKATREANNNINKQANNHRINKPNNRTSSGYPPVNNTTRPLQPNKGQPSNNSCNRSIPISQHKDNSILSQAGKTILSSNHLNPVVLMGEELGNIDHAPSEPTSVAKKKLLNRFDYLNSIQSGDMEEKYSDASIYQNNNYISPTGNAQQAACKPISQMIESATSSVCSTTDISSMPVPDTLLSAGNAKLDNAGLSSAELAENTSDSSSEAVSTSQAQPFNARNEVKSKTSLRSTSRAKHSLKRSYISAPLKHSQGKSDEIKQSISTEQTNCKARRHVIELNSDADSDGNTNKPRNLETQTEKLQANSNSSSNKAEENAVNFDESTPFRRKRLRKLHELKEKQEETLNSSDNKNTANNGSNNKIMIAHNKEIKGRKNSTADSNQSAKFLDNNRVKSEVKLLLMETASPTIFWPFKNSTVTSLRIAKLRTIPLACCVRFDEKLCGLSHLAHVLDNVPFYRNIRFRFDLERIESSQLEELSHVKLHSPFSLYMMSENCYFRPSVQQLINNFKPLMLLTFPPASQFVEQIIPQRKGKAEQLRAMAAGTKEAILAQLVTAAKLEQCIEVNDLLSHGVIGEDGKIAALHHAGSLYFVPLQREQIDEEDAVERTQYSPAQLQMLKGRKLSNPYSPLIFHVYLAELNYLEKQIAKDYTRAIEENRSHLILDLDDNLLFTLEQIGNPDNNNTNNLRNSIYLFYDQKHFALTFTDAARDFLKCLSFYYHLYCYSSLPYRQLVQIIKAANQCNWSNNLNDSHSNDSQLIDPSRCYSSTCSNHSNKADMRHLISFSRYLSLRNTIQILSNDKNRWLKQDQRRIVEAGHDLNSAPAALAAAHQRIKQAIEEVRKDLIQGNVAQDNLATRLRYLKEKDRIERPPKGCL
jgi:hypothetical protein